METTFRLHILKANESRSYAFAGLFVAGNILFPQLCHLLPLGGQILLPIYFFTLIAAYKYGFFTGLLTAIASPLINHALFGMPGTEMLTAILIKSVLLVVAASYMANRTKQVRIIDILMVIFFYQGIGSLVEWGITANLFESLQDFRIGAPGMTLQLVGGYFCIKALH